jgi:predicted amidohydrolase YtcJ
MVDKPFRADYTHNLVSLTAPEPQSMTSLISGKAHRNWHCKLRSSKIHEKDLDSMTPSADILIYNARVFTADKVNPSAEALAVKGNRIVFVGSNTSAKDWQGSITRVIDGGGSTLMPGFIDCHYHLLMSSLTLDDINLEEAKSYEEVVVIIKEYASRHPDKYWLPGTGMHYNLGPAHAALTRQHLDAIIPDRPLLINAYDGHTSWANTLALQKADILHGSECAPNSEIVLDEHGEATGELLEGADEKVTILLPKPDAAEERRLLKKGLKMAARLGVTSVHNMDGNDTQAALYAALEASGELTTRVYIPLSIRLETPFENIEKDALAMKHRYQSDMLRSRCVKLFMDGVIESYTGLLVEDYVDRPDVRGGSEYEIEHFNRKILEADRLGLQIFVHAIGDLGVRRVLDAYELAQKTNGKRDSRHRIEHIELIHPDDVDRFAELGVIASMQPLHAPPHLLDGDVWPWRVGRERWPYSFAWSTLRQAGATLVFGSDWSVVSQNPLLGIHNVLNRQPWAGGIPDQRQSLTDTLLSYTRDAAYAEFQEQQKGQLKAGYLADMVLLSQDIFHTPPDEIKDILPHLTIMDGRIVYEK